jgi:pimeloyl-ACP methyl ester carboxylesterase
MPDPDELEFVPSRFGPVGVRRRGTGRPLILMHGGTGSANHWAANVEALATLRQVAAMDLPGFGVSASPQAAISPQEYIDGLVDIVSGIVPSGAFDLAGFSFGAVCAAEVAVRLGQRVGRLVLVAPGGFGAIDMTRLDLRKIPLGRSLSRQARSAAAHNLGKTMLLREPAPEAEAVALHLYNVAHSRFDSHRVSFADNLLDLIRHIPARLMVIWGAEDALVGPGGVRERYERVGRARPDSRRVIVPAAGHWLMYEAAARFNASMTDFLDPAEAGDQIGARLRGRRTP